MVEPQNQQRWQCMNCLLVFRPPAKKPVSGLYKCPNCGSQEVGQLSEVRKDVQEAGGKTGKHLLKG